MNNSQYEGMITVVESRFKGFRFAALVFFPMIFGIPCVIKMYLTKGLLTLEDIYVLLLLYYLLLWVFINDLKKSVMRIIAMNK